MDVWRAQHPQARDYSFHSTVHNTYTGLDYILVEHRLLEAVVKLSIKTTPLSAHDPAIVELRLTGTQNRSGNWRLNKDLIQEKEVEKTPKGNRTIFLVTWVPGGLKGHNKGNT